MTAAIAVSEGLGKGKPRVAIGPKALRSIGAFIAELNTTRKRGYALADEEAEGGVAAIAVAIQSPEDNAVLGTTSVAGPVIRVTRDRHDEIVSALQATAADLALAWPLAQSGGSASRRGRA